MQAESVMCEQALPAYRCAKARLHVADLMIQACCSRTQSQR